MKWLKRLMIFLFGRNAMTDDEVCFYSRNMGEVDYHDYPDSLHGEPQHMVDLICKRCGKKFII